MSLDCLGQTTSCSPGHAPSANMIILHLASPDEERPAIRNVNPPQFLKSQLSEVNYPLFASRNRSPSTYLHDIHSCFLLWSLRVKIKSTRSINLSTRNCDDAINTSHLRVGHVRRIPSAYRAANDPSGNLFFTACRGRTESSSRF